MNKYDLTIKDLKEQINILRIQKEANEDKIKSMMKEIEENRELKENYNKLNEDYN